MNQASYVFLMLSPTLVVVFFCLCLLFWSWYKEKGYMTTLLECIVMNVFPEILEKTTEDGNITYFNKVKMMLRGDEQLKPKVKRGLFWVSSLLIINILQLFGAFLFLKTSSYCDETKDCFLVGGPIDHPVNCDDLKKKNETIAVVCYEIVFRLPTAAGLCYGIFKTCTVALTVSTTLYLKMNLNPDKIVCTCREKEMSEISLAKYFVLLVCVVCMLLTLILYRGPLDGLDWEEVNTEATVVLACLLTIIYVCVMPWEELAHLKQNNEGAAEEGLAYAATIVPALTEYSSQTHQSSSDLNSSKSSL